MASDDRQEVRAIEPATSPDAVLAAGVDVGGTFTDVVVTDAAGLVEVHKIPSTPHDPSVAVLQGLRLAARSAGRNESDIVAFLHGTTVATNAVIERTRARMALVTTTGFRDVLEIGRLRRGAGELYVLNGTEWTPIVERRLRLELSERTDQAGTVVRSVARDEIEELVGVLRKHAVGFVAVCLLHSHRNPHNELAVARLFQELAPEIDVTLSHQVLPEVGEYERTSAAVLNTFLKGPVRPYIQSLSVGLTGLGVAATPYLMQSNGGVIEVDAAADYPIQLLLSGPAAGVAGSLHAAQACATPDIVTFDMGGTSCDVGVITDGAVGVTTQRDLAGMPVRIPSVDVIAIGTGGGSIAWVDHDGRFRVGPQSAGADPGPACYGRGGQDCTVTDADVVLGYLPADGRLGAEDDIEIDAAAGENACKRLGGQLSIETVEETAWSVLELAHTQMAGAVRRLAAARGLDLRRFSLLAYGGAGPVHAVHVAAKAGMHQVIIPSYPGCHSAHGLLRADLRQDHVVALESRMNALDPTVLDRAFDALHRMAPPAGSSSDSVFAGIVDVVYRADIRYAGQQFTVSVDLNDARELHERPADLRARFDAAHHDRYGHSDQDRVVEITALRATHKRPSTIAGATPARANDDRLRQRSGREPATRRMWLPQTGWAEAAVTGRHELREGEPADGPLVVTQPDTTVLVPPGVQIQAVAGGYLLIEIPSAWRPGSQA